jgi:TRAP-type C4-dicarboxylate transport system substrate-binding protein
VRSLVFANMYARPENVPEIGPFVENVRRLGGGRLRLVVVDGWTSRRERDEERVVLEDVADGATDLAWVGARAVGAVLGVDSLEPLHAPLLFPDEKTVAGFLLSGVVTSLLAPLREAGLIGLALLPGGLRRPFGITAPLVGVEDWQDKVIRTHSSLTADATLRALGATPVLRSSAELASGPPPGVDGMDIDLKALQAWRYTGWLTWNVALWPRLVLLVASRQRFERLSGSERHVLTEAARGVVATPRSPERPNDLPSTVRVVNAGDDDLARLRIQLAPIHDGIRSTGEGERTLREIERFLANRRAASPVLERNS